jgi:two-component system response regulator GlrR
MTENGPHVARLGSLRIATRDREMLAAVETAQLAAPAKIPVLIEGETGTGKERIARGVHEASARSGPFVPLNCGAIPENLFEAELFGAQRGAYTGLDSERVGLFRQADGGTLFLDEIGDLPKPVQVKLLRVLQDGEVRSLGATRSVKVDVRLVAATNVHLASLVRQGVFREDLYFRISVAYVRLPPLRARRDDISLLVRELVDESARLLSFPARSVDPAVVALAEQYSWPGNIRELANIVSMAVLASRGPVIGLEEFAELGKRAATDAAGASVGTRPFFEAIAAFERAYLQDLLRRTGGNLSEASRIAGLSRAALRAKAAKHGLLDEASRSGAPKRPGSRSRVRTS